MTRKSVLVMVLMVFLADTLGLTVKVERVEASETIYIRADGSVKGTTHILTVDNVIYTFTDDIYDEIVIERNNIILDGIGYTLQGLGSGTGIYLLERSNVSITNIEIRAFEYGILLAWSYNNSLAGNNITTNSNGIWLEGSSNNTVFGNDINNCIVGVVICCSSSNNTIFGNNIINNDWGVNLVAENTVSGNNITNNRYSGVECHSSYNSIISGNNITNNRYYYGVYFYSSFNNTVFGNKITDNNFGVYFYSSSNNIVAGNNIAKNNGGVYLAMSSNNRFYHNNFKNNASQVYIYPSSSANFLDDGYPSGGNYWSNYTDLDLYSGPYQSETGSDGIWDYPYVINANNKDNYPLTKPYGGPYDIGIIGVTTSKTVVGEGYNLKINTKILNYGINTEIFNVTAYANATIIARARITLTSRNPTTVPFTWNTLGVAKGNYRISVFATPVLGEANLTDNTYVDGWVLVTIPGDINGDSKVDHRDLLLLASGYGSEVGDPRYIPEVDINCDGKIDHKDLLILASNYGKGN